MVRILEEVPRKGKTVVCSTCGRTLEYFLNEVHESSHTDYAGGSGGMQTIVCPAKDCGKMIVLKQW